jgi:hypothetical protein
MKIRDKIRKSLELESEGFRRRWQNDPIGMLEKHCGRRYPRKLRECFEDIYFGRVSAPAIIANRGGGKTVLFADLGTCEYLFNLYDVFFVGGSEAQAKLGFSYSAENLGIEEGIEDFNAEITKTLAKSQYGNWMKFAAASTKRVRGPHCGDPHPENGMKQHGGMLIIDEECETEDEIVISAKKTVNTAEPGLIVRGSTLHKLTGSFAELCEDPGAQGVTLYKWDAFDTTVGCDKKCSECPVIEFAGRKRKDWQEWRKQHPEWDHEGGYCEGKAKIGGGWRRIWGSDLGTIEASWIGKTCREEFEVEEMGWRPAAGGQVLDPALLDKCLRGAAVFMPGMPVMITIDWGMKGWTAIHVLQEQANRVIVVTQSEYYHDERDEIIYMRCKALREMWNVNTACADASHPYQNANLKYMGFDVEEVSFNEWKEFGAGWIRGLTEQGRLWLQGEMGNGNDESNGKNGRRFEDAQTARLFRELKGWKRGKDGKIVKKNDHGPDSLLCAAARWGSTGAWKAEHQSAGIRESVAGMGKW